MNKSISSALCLIAIFVASISPVSAIATGETVATAMTVAAVTGTDGSVTPTDPASTEGLSLTPDEIAALQNQSEATSSDSNKSVFTKASDFVSDHAPFFIIGIIVLAAILAGIFIARGRRKVVPEPTTPIPVAAAGAAAKAAGPPAAVPSTKELRRQKRAAAQEAREQERRRRKAGFDGRSRKAAPPIATDVGPLVSASTASMALDPIEAEKRAARNPPAIAPSPAPSPPPASVATPSTSRSLSTPAATVVAGAAVGAAVGAGAGATSFNPGPGTGAIPAPVSPSQTAPAAGIQTPDQVAAASIQNPDDTIYSPQGEAVAEAAGAAPDPIPEPPTQVTQPAESSFDSPEPDARVGEAAAGFAVGAAGGSIAANAVSSNEEEISPVAAPVSDPGAADAEQRLRAKVEEIKAGHPRIPGPAPAVRVPVPEPFTDPVADQLAEEADADLERKRVQAEAVRREIDELQPTVEPIGGTSNLEGVERRLVENRENRDRTLQIAEDRLRLIEERAEQAERRAAFAERLTKLNLEESEREQRLNDVLTGIDRAEERTLEAEARA